MSISYKKLLRNLLISTILSWCTLAFATSSTNVQSGYFYSKDYEGMAGYCAVITPELEDVSDTMGKVLKINKFKNKKKAIHYSSQTKRAIQKSNNYTFSQFSNQQQTNTNEPKENPKNTFETVISYINLPSDN